MNRTPSLSGTVFRSASRVLALGLLVAGCREVERDAYQGYVEGEYVYVATSVGGDLDQLAVRKGQTVAAGAPLYSLDPNPEALQAAELEQRMEQSRAKQADLTKGSRPSELATVEARWKRAQAAHALAQRDFERRSELHQLGGSDAVSDEELDRYRSDAEVTRAEAEAIEAELVTARLGGRPDAIVAAEKDTAAIAAALRELDWRLAEKRVNAPVAGIVQDTLYRRGEFVPPGRPVVSLLPPENVKLRFFVPQARLPSIQVGDRVSAALDGLEQRVLATVSFVSTEAEFTPPVIYSKDSRAKLVFMIEALPAEADRKRLHPGQPVDVRLE